MIFKAGLLPFKCWKMPWQVSYYTRIGMSAWIPKWKILHPAGLACLFMFGNKGNSMLLLVNRWTFWGLSWKGTPGIWEKQKCLAAFVTPSFGSQHMLGVCGIIISLLLICFMLGALGFQADFLCLSPHIPSWKGNKQGQL